ncbi:MAG TPA: hypothetical protein VMH81_18980 [Bryobacteraceae bacterium]|nr:hypothetical protein [Bryobacteraceae bacterium]
MRRMRPVLLAFLCPAALAAQTAPAQDWTIVAGLRVGPIAATAVRADLPRLFPTGAVEDDEIELDEGMLQAATLVYKNDPSQALAISWDGKGPQAHPRQIFICHGLRRGACRWQVAGGIRFGTTLAELESLNGGHFTLSGFGFNYGGNVTSWDGGKLARLDCGGRVVLTLDGARTGGRYSVPMTPEEVHAVRGDRPISSSTPAMQKLNPRVVGILFQFAGSESTNCR